MSDMKLEDDLRRALRATADNLVVDERPFVAEPSTVVELPDSVRARRPRRVLVLAAAVLAVFVAAGVVIRQTTGSNGGGSVAEGPTVPTNAAPATTGTTVSTAAELAATVASVPVNVLDAIGTGTASASRPRNLSGPMLVENGKPRVVWIGAEYCPYCAAERWSLILALSRFGTFSGLGLTSSSPSDVFPGTPTFSFHGSTYSSRYLSFDGVEMYGNVPTPDGGYVKLDTPTAEEQALLTEYDSPPYVATDNAGAIPFLDFANVALISGATLSPAVLHEQTATVIASALSDPTSDIATAVDGSANMITAVLCELTRNQPVIVCSDPMITALERQLGPQNGPAPTGPTG